MTDEARGNICPGFGTGIKMMDWPD